MFAEKFSNLANFSACRFSYLAWADPEIQLKRFREICAGRKACDNGDFGDAEFSFKKEQIGCAFESLTADMVIDRFSHQCKKYSMEMMN